MNIWTVLKNVLKINSLIDLKYLRAVDVWNAFKMNTMGDYHDLYLKTDILLLADVFEKFINTCLEYYGLDPCHYFSSPGLSWHAMIKMTEIELELISDIDMYLFLEKGMRGGISYVDKRYSKANDKHTTDSDSSEESKYTTDYDRSEESKFIHYLDANNLW